MAAQPAPDDSPPIRIALAEDLKSRDGTLTKDSLITNGFVENFGGGVTRVYKRSGLSTLLTPASGTGFGMTSLVDANGNESLWYATASGTILQYAASYGFVAGHYTDGVNDYYGFWTSGSQIGVSSGVALGSLTPSNLNGAALVSVYQYQIFNGSDWFFVCLSGTLAQNYFTSVTCNGTTLTTAAAAFSTSGGESAWAWNPATLFAGTGTFPLSFTL